MWKAQWKEFAERQDMPDGDGLSFLKELSIPIKKYKVLQRFPQPSTKVNIISFDYKYKKYQAYN